MKKHCCRSIQIWEYTPVHSRNTAADQYKSGNIHQSLIVKTAANEYSSGNIHQCKQETQLQINTNLGISTSPIKKNRCRSIQIWEYTPVAEKQLQINTNLGIYTSPIKKHSCRSIQIWEYTPVADGEKQLQMNTNLGISTSPLKKHSCRSIQIWEYTPVQSRKTGANQYQSGNIQTSMIKSHAHTKVLVLAHDLRCKPVLNLKMNKNELPKSNVNVKRYQPSSADEHHQVPQYLALFG
jgi:hypothetical protein